MNYYIVKKFAGDWDAILKAKISGYPWGGSYRPEAYAKLAYDDNGLLLSLTAVEERENMRRVEEGLSTKVHLDSCLEFFLMPLENDPRYINFEVNPNGAHNIGIGDGRPNRYRFTAEELSPIEIKAAAADAESGFIRWDAFVTIPQSFIAQRFDGFSLTGAGQVMRGNFMICGDNTPTPHFGMWSKGGTPTPDYHQSKYFGYLELK
ncbi:hypothetical protein FACS1894127_7040 [Clostridia bacterium]|nr:hypothetical protein FACS1894127_7040 [Clostridia bacterium]